MRVGCACHTAVVQALPAGVVAPPCINRVTDRAGDRIPAQLDHACARLRGQDRHRRRGGGRRRSWRCCGPRWRRGRCCRRRCIGRGHGRGGEGRARAVAPVAVAVHGADRIPVCPVERRIAMRVGCACHTAVVQALPAGVVGPPRMNRVTGRAGDRIPTQLDHALSDFRCQGIRRSLLRRSQVRV